MSRWQERLELFGTRPFENELGRPTRLLAAQLAVSPVLECGCASALDFNYFKQLGKKYTGVDITPAFVDAALVRGANVHLGSILKIPFADETFKTAYCRHVLEHLDMSDVPVAVAEMARVASELLILTFFIPPSTEDKMDLQVDPNGFYANQYTHTYITNLLSVHGAVARLQCHGDDSVMYVCMKSLVLK